MHEYDNEMGDLSIRDNHWYSADTKLGKIYIGIDRMQNNDGTQEMQYPDLLQKAIALIRGEVIITHIEEWLNCGLFIQPATIIPTSIYTIEIRSIGNNQDHGVNRIVLGIQDSAIDKLSEPSPNLLENISVETSSIPVQFVLSQFHIDKEQFELIDSGRILLIPDSYDGDWRIKLENLRHKNMFRVGILSRDVRTLLISDLAPGEKDVRDIRSRTDQQDDLRPLTITLRGTIPISLDRFLGWKGEKEILLNQSLRHYKADVRCESNLIASGHLISVANGYGINIGK